MSAYIKIYLSKESNDMSTIQKGELGKPLEVECMYYDRR